MTGEMVRDRAFLALLFVVGGSSLLWGLYELFYVSPTAPAGVFNTVLGLMVLLVTWAFLFPYVIPSSHGDPAPGDTPVYRPYLAKPIAPATLPGPRAPARRAPAPRGTVANPRPLPIATAPPAPRIPPRAAPPSRPFGVPVAAAPVRTPPAPSVPRVPRPVPVRDLEIEEILADLPESLDADLAAENADEVIQRIDALLRDLAGDDDRVPTSPRV
jgi:hypothetical protein